MAQLFAGAEYFRDKEGRKTETVDVLLAAWSSEYGLDPIGRLVNHTRSGFLQEWELDKANNWVQYDETVGSTTDSESRTHNAANELTAMDSTSLSYDAAGNLVGDGTHTYRWDFKNRLREVRLASDNSLVAKYHYDTEYARLAKQVGADTTTYLMDGKREAVEESTFALTSKTIVYGNYIDEIVAVQMSLPTPGSLQDLVDELEAMGTESAFALLAWLEAQQDCVEGLSPCPAPPSGAINDTAVMLLVQNAMNPQSVGTFYYHQDDLFSLRLITNLLGQATDWYAYDPYGQIHHLAGTSTESRLFTGRNHDAESGLFYYRTRYYDPDQGRFINRDTIGIWGDESNLGNAYTYGANRPHLIMDPSGCAFEMNYEVEPMEWFDYVIQWTPVNKKEYCSNLFWAMSDARINPPKDEDESTQVRIHKLLWHAEVLEIGADHGQQHCEGSMSVNPSNMRGFASGLRKAANRLENPPQGDPERNDKFLKCIWGGSVAGAGVTIASRIATGLSPSGWVIGAAMVLGCAAGPEVTMDLIGTSI